MLSPESSHTEGSGENNILNHAVLEHIASLVTDAHEKREYRPVGVAIVENTLGHLLLVQSAKNLDDWWFPQGGVESDESALQAVLRESHEEVGILPNQLTFMRFFGSTDLDAEANRADKRGFTRGKRYLFFKFLYEGAHTLMIQGTELTDYRWTPKDQLVHQLATTRSEKKQMLSDNDIIWL